MSYSTIIYEYLGEGNAASRPSTLNINPLALGLYYATDTKVLSLWNGSSWDTLGGTNLWNPVISLGGARPLAGQELALVPLAYSASLPSGLTGSIGGCEVAPTATATFTIYKNGSSIGTAQISASATTATFTFASMVSFVSGDLLTLKCPNPQDATLSGPYFSLLGSR